MSKFRPTSDVSAPGWTSTAGTLAAAINEAVADDASYITSPALAATVDPYRFAIGPIAAGTLTKTIRAQRTGSVGDVRLVLFDAGGLEVGASEWQAVTPDWAAYTLSVTTTGSATQGEIQVRGVVVLALADLTDVVITTPLEGQELMFSAALNKWVNA